MSGIRLDGRDNNASGDDALLWLNKPNNNDWGIIQTGDDDYGIDLRMASTHNYAIRVLRGGSEAFRVNSDYAYHYSDMRSPIFYDSSSTGYYLDPAGASNLNTSVRANEFYARNWFRNDNSGEGLYNQATGMHWYSDSSSRFRLYSGSSSTSQILMTTSGNNARGYVYATNSNEIGFLDQGGSWAIRHQNDNGTYFYTDGSTLEFRVGRDTVTGNYGTVQTSTTRGGWGGYSITGHWVFMHDHSNAAGIYNDIENEWAILMYRNSTVQLMHNGTYQLETQSYGVYMRDQVRASIYYDHNTGYYFNGNGNSRMSTAHFIGNQGRYTLMTGPEVTYTNGSTSVYNDGNRYSMLVNAPYYPHLYINAYARNGNTTHGAVLSMMGGLTAGGYRKWNIGIANTNPNELSIGHYDNNQNPHYGVGVGWSYPAKWWIDTGGNSYASNSFRAPIFYDNNNTGYYADPASTSYFNSFRSDDLRNRYSVSTNHTYGMYFSSDRSSAYAIFREGGGWSYRYPDLRIAFHTGIKFGANANYNGMRFYNDYNMATQVMSVNNATDPLGGNNVYVNYNLQAGSSLIAPYFYDSNNTGCYMNPASNHASVFSGVNNRTMAMMNLPGHTRNSGELNRSRPLRTSDTNYWTGAMGWGRQDMNVVSTWGSGFIDSWSNPAN